MDGNFNPDSSDNTQNESNELEQLEIGIEEIFPETAPKKPKKKHKFFGSIWSGILIGILFSVAVLLLGSAIFHMVTGDYLVFGGVTEVASVSESRILDEDVAQKIAEVTSYIDLYFTGEYDDETLQDGLIHGLVEALGDKYSVYYNAEEYEDFMVSNTGSYAGIGAGLSQDSSTNVVTITKVYEGTPAEEAGLLAGDQILYADDVEATTVELSDLVSHIRGEEGTTVTLKIYRSSTDETFTVDVERKNIVLPSIEYNMMDENVGYIQITQFQTDTDEQFELALNDLEQQGMEKLIVDLRDNPGGLLDSVVNILDVILPKGTVVYTEDKYGNQTTYSSDANCIDYPMAVLINGNSASASEIFAGAIKDYEYGTLIGTTSFGKGIVQSIFQLSDSDGLKITTANYYTPNGNFIHGVGIDPDIELEYEFQGEEGATYEQSLDNQLMYAFDYITGKATADDASNYIKETK